MAVFMSSASKKPATSSMRARYYLNISGEEFLRRWRNGDYVGKTDEFGVATLAMLLPLVDEDSRSVG